MKGTSDSNQVNQLHKNNNDNTFIFTISKKVQMFTVFTSTRLFTH